MKAGPFSGVKIMHHLDRVQLWQDGRNPPPVTMEFDPTNVCQLDCGFCTNAAHRCAEPVALSRTVGLQVIRDMGAMGVRGVTLTGGGEPLCSPYTLDFMRAAYSEGINVALITNGVALTEEIAREVLYYCTWVRVSLDAYDPASYARAKGVPERVWAKALQGVTLLGEFKARLHSPCTVGVGYLTDCATAHGMVPAASLLAEVPGIDYLQFRPITYTPSDERVEDDPVQHQRLVESYLPLAEREAARRYGFRVLASTPKYKDLAADRPYARCSGVYFSSVVGATGDVWACCHMRGDARYSLGNVNQERFAALWNDMERRERVYAGIRYREDCQSPCRHHKLNCLLQSVREPAEHKDFI